jgi:CheY-like chemotaxis protein
MRGRVSTFPVWGMDLIPPPVLWRDNRRMIRGEQAVILLVENSAQDALRLRQALDAAKVRNPFFVVRSGEEAREYLEGTGTFVTRAEFPLPDLILLDLDLPGVSGLRVLQRIRNDPWLRGLRVIVLTNSDGFHDINAAYELGANAFLVKPQKFEDYPRLLRTLATLWLHQTRGPKVERATA